MFFHLQMKSLSKLGYEGYTLLVNKSSGDYKMMCSSELTQEFVANEADQNHPLEERLFGLLCGDLLHTCMDTCHLYAHPSMNTCS